MKPAAIFIAVACLAPLVPAADASQEVDLLRFLNGDQLHGTFQGVKDKQAVSWFRSDTARAVDFQTAQLRQIVFHGGKTIHPIPSSSHITLINGDEIPGDILGLDEMSVTIATGFSAPLRIAREYVVSLSPCPYGGKLLYNGPFSAEGWETVRSPGKTQKPEADGETDTTKPRRTGRVGDPAAQPWSFSGAAWYDRGESAALLHRDVMPDRAILRFHLAWKNRLMLAVAFHSDPCKPSGGDGKESTTMHDGAGVMAGYPRVFGNSYVIQMFSNYVMLFRCAINAKGQAHLERVQADSSNVHMPEIGEVAVELRCDRKSGVISLFLDGQFTMQWNEPGGGEYAGRGKAFGFQVPAEGAPTRISDVMVSEWNGMPDSARSMKSDDQDVLLLASGTERFSGESSRINSGTVTLRGKYGTYQIPLADCAELHLAAKHAKTPPDAAKDAVRLIFQPVGRITGILNVSPAGTVTLASTLAGTLSVPCDSANILQFQPTEHFLDDWDSEF